MTFDALAMHAVKDELEDNLLGGYVEKVIPLSALDVGLRVRSRRRDFSLLMSANPQSARVHLVGGTLRRLTDQVTPFLLLLRKYIREGRIVSIEQPMLERMIELVVEKQLDDGPTATSRLIIEAMGRHSNVILVGSEGKVLDSLKRVPPSLSRLRPILPHLPYSPPPGAQKLDPLSAALTQQLASTAEQAGDSAALWRFLQERIMGLGPLAAREVTYRATGSASSTLGDVASWEGIVEALSSLLRPLRTREWTPSVVLEEGEVIHFAPYRITQFPSLQLEEVSSISEAIERAYSERAQIRPAESLRIPLRSSLEARIDRARRKEESLRQALARGERAEDLKAAGQAILASVAQIGSEQVELVWEDRSIKLDPALTPSENAQRYFKEYAKARDATQGVPAMLESASLEREYLQQMLAHVELAQNDVELRAISRELKEAEGTRPARAEEQPRPAASVPVAGRGRRASRPKKLPKAKDEGPAGTVRRLTTTEGHPILVGGSARGNDRVTFDLGGAGDVWLHARGLPGAHVILKAGGAEPSERAIAEAARVAAANSQARGATKVPVDYTLQRYVKKVKGGPPGLVTYSQEKTILVDATEQD
jgi:predicted ribosome quality control (RQC) complex YloA/Tae2 family protein